MTKKAIAQRQKIEAMRLGRERARMARPVEERAPELPELRRRIDSVQGSARIPA